MPCPVPRWVGVSANRPSIAGFIGTLPGRWNVTPPSADFLRPEGYELARGLLAQADSGAVTAGEVIEDLLSAQIVLRYNRRLQTAMRSSRLPAVKTLDRFDFSFQLSIVNIRGNSYRMRAHQDLLRNAHRERREEHEA